MKTYIYPYSPLPVALQTLVSQDSIVLRSFHLSGGTLNHGFTLSTEEARSLLRNPVEPHIPSRSTPENCWIPRDAVDGNWVGGPADAGVGSFLQEISQISFILDPNILGSAAISERAEWIVPCNSDGRLSMPLNRTLLTQPARSHKTAIYQDRQQSTAITVMMPYADLNFGRAIVYAKMNPAYGLVHNFAKANVVSPDGISFDGYETLSKVDGIWPVLKISGPNRIAADETVSCFVTIHHPDSCFLLEEAGMRIDVEASAGYLAHRAIQTYGGKASFSLSALGLAPGDQIKLKAGWRNYPGAAEKIITVV